MVRHIAATLLLLAAIPVQAIDLPQPPAGFRWEQATDIGGAFLVLNGWNFRQERQGDVLAYFATREDISKGGEFLVGLTINVTPRLQGRDAVAYAKKFIQEFPIGKKLLKSWDASMGPFVGQGCLVQDLDTTFHTLMIANPKTNTLYFFMFEAPSREWADAWKIGERMVKLMLLDDEI